MNDWYRKQLKNAPPEKYPAPEVKIPVRVIDHKLMSREKGLLPGLRVAGAKRVDDMLKKWQELYYRAFGSVYPISGKERGMMKTLCKECPPRLITCAFAIMFMEYLGEKFYIEKQLVPSLELFLRKADGWKSKALLYEKFVDPKSVHWFCVNQAQADLSNLSPEVTALKTEIGLDGDVYITSIKDRRLEKIKVWRTAFNGV